MTTWAVPGAKVVCVSARAPKKCEFPFIPAGTQYPKEGLIYTIRKIVYATSDGEQLFLLAEVKNPPCAAWKVEPGFRACNFRPVVLRRTEAEDTAMFLSLLKSTDPLDRALMLLDLFEL